MDTTIALIGLLITACGGIVGLTVALMKMIGNAQRERDRINTELRLLEQKVAHNEQLTKDAIIAIRKFIKM